MRDWLPAIQQRWARLQAEAGRLWLHRAPQGTAFPICAVVPVSDVPDYSSEGHVREIHVQFSVFHTSADEADRIAERIVDVFHDADLHIQDSYAIHCRLLSRNLLTETDDEEPVFHALREFQIFIGHN